MIARASKRIKVLIVEDSAVVAEFLTHLLNSDPAIEVVSVARDGVEGVDAAQRCHPDVITMDVHMPRVDGFEATRQIMETCPVPIVIVSANSGEAAMNFHALEAGALAVIARPEGRGHSDHARSAAELLDTVKLMSEVKVVKRWTRSRASLPAIVAPSSSVSRSGSIETVVIGASTGGPLALQILLKGLPAEFPAALLIVQHMTPGFTPGFVEWLSKSAGFPVKMAVRGACIQPGVAYVAPDGFQMGLTAARHIALSDAPPENRMRPSVSHLFRSARAVLGSRVAGVLLTGMGQDGSEELKALKDRGAITFAQDEESSVVHGMPGHAIFLGAASYVLPPEEIARVLVTLLRKS
jgi:two-component system chemotaxis response regulator CheB